MRIINKFDNWKKLSEDSPSKIIERILINLEPKIIIEGSLYVEYIGDIDKKDIFNEYFNKERVNIINYLKKSFSINNILPYNQLNEDKVNWLKSLVEVYQPKDITFHIKT
jgi:hypothetical protein